MSEMESKACSTESQAPVIVAIERLDLAIDGLDRTSVGLEEDLQRVLADTVSEPEPGNEAEPQWSCPLESHLRSIHDTLNRIHSRLESIRDRLCI